MGTSVGKSEKDNASRKIELTPKINPLTKGVNFIKIAENTCDFSHEMNRLLCVCWIETVVRKGNLLYIKTIFLG